jgi:hypothetical protein
MIGLEMFASEVGNHRNRDRVERQVPDPGAAGMVVTKSV